MKNNDGKKQGKKTKKKIRRKCAKYTRGERGRIKQKK